MHLPTVHVCTKFQPSGPYSSWEKYDEKFECLKIGEKEKWRNKGMNTQQQPDSGLHDASAHCPRVYQVWRKFLMFENWREEKWRNKGTNTQQQPDDTSAYCPRVYQVSIF